MFYTVEAMSVKYPEKFPSVPSLVYSFIHFGKPKVGNVSPKRCTNWVCHSVGFIVVLLYTVGWSSASVATPEDIIDIFAAPTKVPIVK
ncbi:MAG: hypothetical protein LBE12_04235 [Planctomycetaceae bacterium]|nr:hypothetical protein [Planctomycetaceae bacterium]